MKKTILYIAAILLAVSFLTRYDLVRVSGESMYPTYNDGDLLMVDKGADLDDLDIVVINVKGDDRFSGNLIVKRYYEEYSTDGLYVLGDNSDNSLDSRYVGEFSKDKLVGVVKINITKKTKGLFH